MIRHSNQSSREVLLPERILRRKLPVNLKDDEFELFGHEIERVIPPAELLELGDVWASSEGFLFKDGRILPESFAAPFLQDNWKSRSRLKFLAKHYLLKKRRNIDQERAWIVDDWSGGYYHWFVDTLPRLYSIRERLSDPVLLLPYRYEGLEFVHASLKAFSLRRVEFIGKDEVFFCRRLLVPMNTAPTGQQDEQIVNGVRRLLVGFYAGGSETARNDRVYISRARARRRRVFNEQEVVGILRDFGFDTVYAEDMTLAQQVATCSAARYLVSNHGAGLTNMLFMQSGGSVLELRNRSGRPYNCYFNLASALSLRYFYQTCETNDPAADQHLTDLVVDTVKLRENIELMLNVQSKANQTAPQ